MNPVHNKEIGTKQKALAINLDPTIYGSFAEIGAGQDVAANFFKAGASSGTIAKTMSAYDMIFSDAIYGAQKGKRYVTESRLISMLDREYGLLIERLAEQRGNTTTFFAFSDTVSEKAKKVVVLPRCSAKRSINKPYSRSSIDIKRDSVTYRLPFCAP